MITLLNIHLQSTLKLCGFLQQHLSNRGRAEIFAGGCDEGQQNEGAELLRGVEVISTWQEAKMEEG